MFTPAHAGGFIVSPPDAGGFIVTAAFARGFAEGTGARRRRRALPEDY